LEISGIHAYVFWAQEKGYFKAEGLDVDIDQGTGSAATVTRIASGTYDAGFGDMNAIIQLAGAKPGEQPVMVYNDLQQAAVRADHEGIEPDQERSRTSSGHTMARRRAARPGSYSLRLPRSTASTRRKYRSRIMQPNLQEQMLLNGQVDFSACSRSRATST